MARVFEEEGDVKVHPDIMERRVPLVTHQGFNPADEILNHHLLFIHSCLRMNNRRRSSHLVISSCSRMVQDRVPG
jgi:hypothetical protein